MCGEFLSLFRHVPLGSVAVNNWYAVRYLETGLGWYAWVIVLFWANSLNTKHMAICDAGHLCWYSFAQIKPHGCVHNSTKPLNAIFAVLNLIPSGYTQGHWNGLRLPWHIETMGNYWMLSSSFSHREGGKASSAPWRWRPKSAACCVNLIRLIKGIFGLCFGSIWKEFVLDYLTYN